MAKSQLLHRVKNNENYCRQVCSQTHTLNKHTFSPLNSLLECTNPYPSPDTRQLASCFSSAGDSHHHRIPQPGSTSPTFPRMHWCTTVVGSSGSMGFGLSQLRKSVRGPASLFLEPAKFNQFTLFTSLSLCQVRYFYSCLPSTLSVK